MRINLSLFIGLCTLLLSCSGINQSLDFSTPPYINLNPPDGPESYKKGYVDGCRSALSGTNHSFMLAIQSHRFTFDEELRYDPLYYRVWKDAYQFCFSHMIIGRKQNL